MGRAVLSERQKQNALRRDVIAWLKTGAGNTEGRLALFDGMGQRIDSQIQRAALSWGWVEGWFANPMRPDWMVCRLTPAGKRALAESTRAR